MAGVDVQWPSEDEDFDAISDEAVATETTEEEQPRSLRSIAISAPEEQPATQEPESVPSAEEVAEAEGPESQYPAEVTEPQTEEEPLAPIPAKTSTPKLPKLPKVAMKKGAMLRYAVEFVLLAAVVVLGLWCWSLHSDNADLKKKVANLNANPQVAVQQQTQALITDVGKLIQLPTDETPTIANVSDAAQARAQSSFFANAENGDKVLMYVKAGEAILYRPSTDRIILVAPLTFTNNGNTAATTTSTTSTKTTAK